VSTPRHYRPTPDDSQHHPSQHADWPKNYGEIQLNLDRRLNLAAGGGPGT